LVKAKIRTIYRKVKSKARRPRKNDLKKYGKKVALGTAAGLIVAIPLTLAAKYFQKPVLKEVAQRGGAIAASAAGGTIGETGFQAADAIFDRFVVVGGEGISGTAGNVYL